MEPITQIQFPLWIEVGLGLMTISNGWLLWWASTLNSKLAALGKRDHELANEIHKVNLHVAENFTTKEEWRAETKDMRQEFRDNQRNQTSLMEANFARVFDKLDKKADKDGR